ncbi:MAG: hypothetical protein JW966_12960 [Anaerolineae bacterium]|nr:hypothetical protein [Anaerolineae bacterium]
MKRLRLVVLAGVLLLLSACGSDYLHDAYTASGDGTRSDDLVKTAVFEPEDDLNVVVKLNAHSRTLPVHAVFASPGGETYATDPVEAGETVGEVLLGLDWEVQGINWSPGAWTVEVYVDNEKETTLDFEVSVHQLGE